MDLTDIYQENRDSLIEMAQHILHGDYAEDIVQDIMALTWERRESLRFVDDLPSYLRRAVRNRCLDIVKHETIKRDYCNTVRSRMLNQLNLDQQGCHSHVSDELEYRETARRLNTAISQLPPRCKSVFQLSRFNGLTADEISTRLGISRNTVSCQMTIALRRLRDAIKVS